MHNWDAQLGFGVDTTGMHNWDFITGNSGGYNWDAQLGCTTGNFSNPEKKGLSFQFHQYEVIAPLNAA